MKYLSALMPIHFSLNTQVRFLLTTFTAIALSGCATSMTSDRFVQSSYESDISGKVIRSIAVGDEWRTEDTVYHRMTRASLGPGLLFRSTWNDTAKKYRWINTFTRTGPTHYSGYHAPSFAVIADDVPAVEKGDIIDVWYMKVQYGHDYDKLIADKVIRLVCKSTDETCISGVKKSNQWNKEYGFIAPADESLLSNLKFSPIK
ncbi:MAG: hypothetical protein ACTS9Y_13805 [Methylophilus sp.]|uniref:hypothetical protein n=1 Tax=Methylophilus sp. TaxID=29541 RepID=UPI003FA06238